MKYIEDFSLSLFYCVSYYANKHYVGKQTRNLLVLYIAKILLWRPETWTD